MGETVSRDLIIAGAGAFGREVAWLAQVINQRGAGNFNIVGLWDHDTTLIGKTMNGIPVLSTEQVKKYAPDAQCVIAIGDPSVKERAAQEARELGCRFATLIHPDVSYDINTVDFGPGSVVWAGNILTVNISVGSHVQIHGSCTVGGDCVIEDYATISPGCRLLGGTVIRQGAFLGAGAVTVENHEIGSRAVIGAGAVVNRNIPPDVVAVGIPARVIP